MTQLLIRLFIRRPDQAQDPDVRTAYGNLAGAVGMVAKNERNYGQKKITDTCTAIVSGGTGTWGYKFRTQGRTEIVCVEIKQV